MHLCSNFYAHNRGGRSEFESYPIHQASTHPPLMLK